MECFYSVERSKTLIKLSRFDFDGMPYAARKLIYTASYLQFVTNFN